MKHSFLLSCCVCLIFCATESAFAQRLAGSKTISSTKLEKVHDVYDQTESFRLDAAYEMLVVPMVASIDVISQEKRTFVGAARTDVPDGLQNNQYLIHKVFSQDDLDRELEVIKSQVIYDFCAEYNADVITLPQFKIKQLMVEQQDGEGNSIWVPQEVMGQYVVTVEATGFPAIYKDFRPGTADDAWIKALLMRGKVDNEDSVLRVNETTTRHSK